MAQYIEHPALRGAAEANAFSRQQNQLVGQALMQSYGALNEQAARDAQRLADMDYAYAQMQAGLSPSGAPMPGGIPNEKVMGGYRNAMQQAQERIQRNMMRRAGRNLQGEAIGPSLTPVTEGAAFLTTAQTPATHPWMAQQAQASNFGRVPLTWQEQQQLEVSTGMPTQNRNSWWRELLQGRAALPPGMQQPPEQTPPQTPPVIGPQRPIK